MGEPVDPDESVQLHNARDVTSLEPGTRDLWLRYQFITSSSVQDTVDTNSCRRICKFKILAGRVLMKTKK